MQESDTGENTIDQNGNFFKQLLYRMNPTQCLAPGAMSQSNSCHNPLFEESEINFEELIPKLSNEIQKEGKNRTAALQQLYKMTDRDRKFNRIPIVCTTKFNVFQGLVPCLSPEASGQDRRQALLILNNLCIPNENKANILLGEAADYVLPPLLRILTERLPESYLAAVCLFNLSYLDDAKSMLLTYVPKTFHRVRTEYHYQPPAENSESLLRVFESLIESFSPYLVHNIQNVQAEAVRWCMGTIRNLVSSRNSATLVANSTLIPQLAIKYLQECDDDLAFWSRDSLPDACLMIIVHLAQYDECLDAISSVETRTAMKKLDGRGGIHELRAKAILSRLDGKESAFSWSSLEEERVGVGSMV